MSIWTGRDEAPDTVACTPVGEDTSVMSSVPPARVVTLPEVVPSENSLE